MPALAETEHVGVHAGRHIKSRGLGLARDTTRIRLRLARLNATYSSRRASGLSGNVFASHGKTITLSHFSPFALWMVLSTLSGAVGRESATGDRGGNGDWIGWAICSPSPTKVNRWWDSPPGPSWTGREAGPTFGLAQPGSPGGHTLHS